MLYLAHSLRELSFEQLMHVYTDSNREHGLTLAPEEPEDRRSALSEQDFYAYLHDVFFRVKDAMYAVWIENGRYVSALRLEPWRDGLLLEALETAPEFRRRGYAARLICAAMEQLPKPVRVYSHISRTNRASLHTHQSCGFVKLHDYAAFLDGSVNKGSVTMVYEK